jgi:phosphoglycolate phosphatase
VRDRIAPSAILYDWDNTLVDAWAGVTAALNAAFAAFDMPSWSVADTRNRVRVAMRESFPVMFGPRWTEARDIFYASLEREHLRHVTPLPGAGDVLVAGGFARQGVVSNKTGRFLRAEVAHLRWSGHFRSVVGAGDAVADKPDPAPIMMALAQLDVPAGSSVWYLGDTALDMRTARAAGATAVLVGDAAHDGGIEHATPDLHFPSHAALAARFRAFGREAGD